MKRTSEVELLFLLVALFLIGCSVATTNSTNLVAKRAKFESTIPTCVTPEDCELKWAAARRWVLQNSGFKLQNVTDDFLETYNATSGSPALAARVVKEPLGGGRYRIVATLWCDNVFGCVPDSWDAALLFNQYVSDAAPKSAQLPADCEKMKSLVRVYAGETLRAKCIASFPEAECDRCLSGIQ